MFVKTGVPQGSLLGVVLFQLLINNMKNCLKYSNAILYADDTTLYILGRNCYFLQQKAQSDLNSLSMWLKSNYLSLNEQKTKYMIIHKKEKYICFNFNLFANGILLERMSHFKFLGIHIDEHLTWKYHCDVLLNKRKQSNYVLNRVRNYIPTGCLRDLYYAHFNSHLVYGIVLWGNSSSKAQIDGIFKQQKLAIRIVTNQPYYSHSEPLFKRVQVLKFHELLELENLKLIKKVLDGRCPMPLKNLFNVNKQDSRSKGIIVKDHKSTIYNNSFLCKAIVAWNKNKVSTDCTNKTFTKNWKTKIFS